MMTRRHGIRFDTDIDAALYALAVSKDYERFARSFPQEATDANRHSRRLEDKGERVLYDLRGLSRCNLYGIDPHLSALSEAFFQARTFVLMRTLQQMPSNLTIWQKADRLVATAPDLRREPQ